MSVFSGDDDDFNDDEEFIEHSILNLSEIQFRKGWLKIQLETDRRVDKLISAAVMLTYGLIGAWAAIILIIIFYN